MVDGVAGIDEKPSAEREGEQPHGHHREPSRHAIRQMHDGGLAPAARLDEREQLTHAGRLTGGGDTHEKHAAHVHGSGENGVVPAHGHGS